jgi:hypothetical protein
VWPALGIDSMYAPQVSFFASSWSTMFVWSTVVIRGDGAGLRGAGVTFFFATGCFFGFGFVFAVPA